jgi:hypothetical protein
MEELQKYHSPGKWEEQLKRIPKGLDDFYDRTVSRITDPEDAFKILQWLAFSFRPLRLLEVVQVVGVIPDKELGLRFDAKHVYLKDRDVLTVCSSLVTVTEGNSKFEFIVHYILIWVSCSRICQTRSHVCQGLPSVSWPSR